MAINFPNSPAPNELFTTAYGTYKWDTHKWVIQEGFTGSFISGGVVYSGTNSLLCSPVGTSGQVLSSNGTSPPTWIDTASFAETTATIKSKLGITTLSGSNTGDETTATIKSKLGITTLSGSNTGDQTITLTGDVTGSGAGSFSTTLATITDSGVGTFKKITTDTKGRVTGTVSVAQADITGLLGAGSITNTMLANSAVATLSGTNTGDETTATIKTKLGITTLSGANTGDVTVANDTTTDSDYYPLFSTTTTGGLASTKVSSTNLTFNPLSGQLNAVTFNSTSDINAKKDISEIKNPLDTVNKIQGVKFSWKHNGKPSYGFIAQDIEKVLPEVVATDTFGMKSVNYDATIAILLEAIKELHKKVEQLQKQ